MIYDRYFLIFGNSEMRLRFIGYKDHQLYSNFECANSFFNHRHANVNDLLGEGVNKDAIF